MECSLAFKEILEAASEIEDEKRKPGSGKSVCKQVSVEGQKCYMCSDDRLQRQETETETKTDKKSKNITFQEDCKDISKTDIVIYESKSKTPAFQEDSKDIFNTDIVTSRFDQPTGNDKDSTSHFLSQPRPMTSSHDDERPLVRYKYKTLSGSSAILSGRRRNIHRNLEKEYRVLKEEIIKMESKKEKSRNDNEQVPQEKDSTSFKKYMDSLWDKREKTNFELVRTKEMKLNFFPERESNGPKLSY